jgi:hypothetical protein
MGLLVNSPNNKPWKGITTSSSGSTVLAVEDGGVWLSTNAGGSFTNVTPPNVNVTVSWYSAAISATGTRLAVSGSGGVGGSIRGGVWVSIDSGATWTAQLTDTSYQALAMSLAD